MSFINREQWCFVAYDDDTEDTEDDGQLTHGEWNNWECDDPGCICHSTEEDPDPVPMPFNALRPR